MTDHRAGQGCCLWKSWTVSFLKTVSARMDWSFRYWRESDWWVGYEGHFCFSGFPRIFQIWAIQESWLTSLIPMLRSTGWGNGAACPAGCSASSLILVDCIVLPVQSHKDVAMFLFFACSPARIFRYRFGCFSSPYLLPVCAKFKCVCLKFFVQFASPNTVSNCLYFVTSSSFLPLLFSTIHVNTQVDAFFRPGLFYSVYLDSQVQLNFYRFAPTCQNFVYFGSKTIQKLLTFMFSLLVLLNSNITVSIFTCPHVSPY